MLTCQKVIQLIYQFINSVLFSDAFLSRSYLIMTSSNAWWRVQMEKFPAPLAICAGNSPVIGEFPAQRPVTRSFDVFFNVRLNKRLSKQSRGWWLETPSRSLWRHCILYPLLGSADATVIQKNICVEHTKWAYCWCYHNVNIVKNIYIQPLLSLNYNVDLPLE